MVFGNFTSLLEVRHIVSEARTKTQANQKLGSVLIWIRRAIDRLANGMRFRPCAYNILLCLIALQVIAGIVEILGRHDSSILVEGKAKLAPMVLLIDVPIINSSINIDFNVLKNPIFNRAREGYNHIRLLIWNLVCPS